MVELVRRSPQRSIFRHFPVQDRVTEEELRMLGLDPTELLPNRENDNMIFFDNVDEYTTDDENIILNDMELMEYDVETSNDFDEMYSPSRHFDEPIVDHISSGITTGNHFEILHFGNYRPIRRIFDRNSVTSSISSASASFSNTNTNNSSNNTNSSDNDTSNNTSDSNSEIDVEESGDELPLDLSSYDPNRFDADEGSSYEDFSVDEEDRDIYSDSQEVVHMNSDFNDETSDSEDSSGISPNHRLSFLLDTNSSSTDTTSDTTTDSTTTDTSSSS